MVDPLPERAGGRRPSSVRIVTPVVSGTCATGSGGAVARTHKVKRTKAVKVVIGRAVGRASWRGDFDAEAPHHGLGDGVDRHGWRSWTRT